MDFIAIDFETANANRSSACSLGLVEVKDGAVVSERSWLIDPGQPFDYRNIQIHGITESMVQGMPTFHELWPELQPLLDGKHIVAHNASFDMSVLRYCLDRASIEYPSFHYYCTYLLSKKMLNWLPSHKLNVLTEWYGIPLHHHDALDDARACAQVLLHLIQQEEQTSAERLSLDLGCKIGLIYPGGYKPFSAPAKKKTKAAKTKVVPAAKNFISG
ncbi:3'-5' exonuclease [Paenibacillus donghaensis]|uniref:3'-5' exonuclease n=1 Tax=Paenibacillus donghaensis TaxID=414771 RepID=UPI0018840128|nr:3'-5' exonuclease [Paenibacillus donghaensis]MBE9915564.1 3'-5' exonuclease [Paenibacillus donghaensis]